MSKVLVVFYSYTGTARRLAQLLCAQQRWAMAEVLDRRPRAGAKGTWRCILDSLLRRTPEFRYQGPASDGFDVVVLIAPIWVYRLAGPMRSFVRDRRATLPDVAVLSVMGSRGAASAVAEIASLTHRTPLLSAAFTTREVDDGSCAGRAQALGDAVRKAKEAAVPARPALWSAQAG